MVVHAYNPSTGKWRWGTRNSVHDTLLPNNQDIQRLWFEELSVGEAPHSTSLPRERDSMLSYLGHRRQSSSWERSLSPKLRFRVCECVAMVSWMTYEKHHSHFMSDSQENYYLGVHSVSGVACDQLLLEGLFLAGIS